MVNKNVMLNNTEVNKSIEPDNKRKSKKDKLFTAIRIIVSAALLAFLITRGWNSLKNVTSVLKELNLVFLLLAVALYLLGIMFEMLRWDMLLRAQNIRISKGFLTQSLFIGYFYSNIFPTNIGGDVYRAYDLHKNKGIPLDKNISVIVVERFIGMLSGTVYLVISFFGVYKYLNLATILSLSVLPLGGLLLFFIILKPKVFKIDRLFKKIRFLTRFEPKYNSFLEHFVSYKSKLRYLLASFVISLAAQLLFYTGFYFGTPGKEGISLEKADNLSKSEKIFAGFVKHYYQKINVAVIDLKSAGLKVGDNIIIEGPTTFIEQKIESLEFDNKSVKKAANRTEIGLKVSGEVRKNDLVFIYKKN